MNKQELYELKTELEALRESLQQQMMRLKHGSSSGSSIEGYEEAFKDGLTVAYEELDESGLLEELNDLVKKVATAINRHNYEYIPPAPGQLPLWVNESEANNARDN